MNITNACRRWVIPAALLAMLVTLALLGYSGDTGLAGEQSDAHTAGGKGGTEQATQIALQTIPGEATAVTIERKLGRHVYVVEIQTREPGEKDVLVDIETGDGGR